MNRTPCVSTMLTQKTACESGITGEHKIYMVSRHINVCESDMKKAYCFRIYPNKNQEVKLNRTLDTCRHLYNDSLAERKKQAEINRLKKTFDIFPWGKPEWINKYDQMLNLTATKTPEQKEVYGQVLQDVIKRVDKSFRN